MGCACQTCGSLAIVVALSSNPVPPNHLNRRKALSVLHYQQACDGAALRAREL
jgi:hypothetical protein